MAYKPKEMWLLSDQLQFIGLWGEKYTTENTNIELNSSDANYSKEKSAFPPQ